MQLALDFGLATPLERIAARLGLHPGAHERRERLAPLDQLIKSSVSSRTRDEDSWAAFLRLRDAFPDWRKLVAAEPAALEAMLGPAVTFADVKARTLPVLMRVLLIKRPDLDFGFLAELSVDEAMSWLKALPGVGVHAAASVLNFSSLRVRTLAVDTHVHRVAKRLGIVPRTSTADEAYHALMAQAPSGWRSDDLFELHWLLKRHGQAICVHEAPECGRCPLAAGCARVDVAGGRVFALGRRPG